MDANNSIITIILTSAVIASFVTSVANIIIAIFYNRRTKSVEKQKRIDELTTYRYTHLFDILKKWHDYDSSSETEDRNLSQIATSRLINGFIDCCRRFEIISPLLDEGYKHSINKLNQKGKQLLSELINIENELDKRINDDLRKRHKILLNDLIDISSKYSSEIKKAVQLQLEQLLKKS